MANLIQHFVHAGQQLRVQGTDAEPSFCALDVCRALGIVNHNNKVAALANDEKFKATVWSGAQRRRMVFVTEPGLYKMILSCRESNVPGTAPHSFSRWVTHEVLPALRQRGRYEMGEQIRQEFVEEKGRRLWNILKNMNTFHYYVRRRYFGRVCNATKAFCYLDEHGAPHVNDGSLEAAETAIRVCLSEAIRDEVPEDQRLITDFF